jgi:hypothetical protein
LTDFKEKFEYAGSKAVSSSLAGAAWFQYEDYEIEMQGEEVYICAPLRLPIPKPGEIHHRMPEDLGKRYCAPLRDHPDLFLRFAALWRKEPLTQDEKLEIVFDWAKSYGVLGLDGIDYLKCEGYSEHLTGRRESIRTFFREVRHAARILELYEAATATNDQRGRLKDVLTRWWHTTRESPLNQQREFALRFVHDEVDTYVSRECYPVLYRTIDKQEDKTIGFTQSFGFRSLIGAMYLQMMWLLIDGDGARRCARPDCPRIITFEPPQLPEDWWSSRGARGKYRTRKDKIYCSPACKQWVYDQKLKRRAS